MTIVASQIALLRGAQIEQHAQQETRRLTVRLGMTIHRQAAAGALGYFSIGSTHEKQFLELGVLLDANFGQVYCQLRSSQTRPVSMWRMRHNKMAFVAGLRWAAFGDLLG